MVFFGAGTRAHIRIRAVVLCVLIIGAVVTYGAEAGAPFGRAGTDTLRVTFFDVGQGDAVFIESPTGVQVLIDGGPDAGVLRVLAREMGFFDRSIDVVIATHPDADHVGGLPDVFARYDVASVLLTENTGESATADAFREYARSEGAGITIARHGMTYDLGGGAHLTVLFPDRDVAMLESNTSSIIVRLTYGEHEFLFTGDAPQSIEDYLVVTYGDALRSDVLKVGHHGSRTSTSELFVAAVNPTYAIISAGEDNRYGHPHKDVLDVLTQAGVITKNTADEGSISFVSDGETLRLK